MKSTFSRCSIFVSNPYRNILSENFRASRASASRVSNPYRNILSRDVNPVVSFIEEFPILTGIS